MATDLYQHFRPEEQLFIDQIESARAQVLDHYSPLLLHFHDPREQYIVLSVLGKEGDVRFSYRGGYHESERKRCLLYPDYYEPRTEDFEIGFLEVHYPVKFGNISHPKILGSLMSAGIKREHFGDIITDSTRHQIILDKTIMDYVVTQVTKIGKMTVHLEPITETNLVIPTDFWEPIETTVSSLRVDAVISSIFHVSRQRAKILIQHGSVKQNFAICERPDALLDIMDIVSVRGHGRIRIDEIYGRSKKDRVRIGASILANNG